MKPGKSVVGPYKGPATLTLAAVPHMARLEDILGVFAVFRGCSQPVKGKNNIFFGDRRPKGPKSTAGVRKYALTSTEP
jgi:hypothetical protein